MTVSAKNQLEYIKLKVFLYKYLPDYQDAGEVDTGLLKLKRYRIELDEAKYFHKYDITSYVAGYSFDQDLYGNTFSWSLSLQDALLTPDMFLTILKADWENPTIVNAASKTNLSTPGFSHLSFAEVSSNEEIIGQNAFGITPEDIVTEAKLNRGTTEDSLIEKASGVSRKTVGLKLSDLIQPYDIVSVYLYKDVTPIEELRGDKVTAVDTPFRAQQFLVNEGGLEQLNAEDLQKESILQSPIPSIPGRTLFSNEFNGFVITKSFSQRFGSVDTLNIQGNGITRLFGATRRILKSSLFESSIYSPIETKDLSAITSLQTIFAGKTVEEILIDLFKFVYNINFDLDIQTPLTVGTTGVVPIPGSFKIVKEIKVNNSFYDLTKMQLGNNRQVNRLNIAPYLLGLVMKRKLFNYREVSSSGAGLQANISELGNLAIISAVEDEVLNVTGSFQNSNMQGNPPVVFDGTINDLRAYFRFMADVFEFFNPETKTPFEILDEVKKVTFAEIFEAPTGEIYVRNPRYNDVENVIFSSSLDIVDRTYSSTVDNLLTKMKVGYGHDFIGRILQAIEYGFSDGKYLLQYGFFESSTDINPNVKNDKSTDGQIDRDRDSLLFKYAEFFLRAHNARLHNGAITCNVDQRIKVGQTFFDEKANKFGYIIGVSKQVGIGQPTLMTLQLSFVRDAYDTLPGEQKGTALRFEKLPTLAEVAP